MLIARQKIRYLVVLGNCSCIALPSASMLVVNEHFLTQVATRLAPQND